jgi:hypothetical protein
VEFRLVYRGPLRTQERTRVQQKHDIRRYLHPQLVDLWSRPPLNEVFGFHVSPVVGKPTLAPVGPFTFFPTVSSKRSLVAEIDVILLRPQDPGSVLHQDGDLDNQLKILFDAFRIPTAPELPPGAVPTPNEMPHFFSLLEDDRLVVKVTAEADRLLNADDPDQVQAVIRVRTKATQPRWDNVELA